MTSVLPNPGKYIYTVLLLGPMLSSSMNFLDDGSHAARVCNLEVRICTSLA